MGNQGLQAPRQFEATYRGLRQSPKKARLIMDLVRNKNIQQALATLQFSHNRAARHIEKVLRSALANAEHFSNQGEVQIDPEKLVICEARVDQGTTLQRWRARSKGMANPIKRRHCHFHVKLCRPEDLEDLKAFRAIKSQKKRVQASASQKKEDAKAVPQKDAKEEAGNESKSED